MTNRLQISQHQMHESLHTRCTAVYKSEHGCRVVTDAVVHCSFSEQLGIVDSLSSRQDLFSSHEHVIRVGVLLQGEHVGFVMDHGWVCIYRLLNTHRVAGVRHGVERPYSQGVFVQHIEVSVILQ